VGASERTVRGRGGGERHGVDDIGCGELRREPHERARERGRLPDMGGDGLGSEGGGGRAERVGRDEGGGRKGGKTSAESTRGLRESRSVGEAEVMLVGFQMRNGFRERLVTGLKERRYHGKKAGGRGYRRGGREERCRGLKMSAKGQHGNGCIGSEGMKRLGTGSRVSERWLRQGGVKCVRTHKGRRPMRRDTGFCIRSHWTRPFHFRTE